MGVSECLGWAQHTHQGGVARGHISPPHWSSCPCPLDWAVYQLWQRHQAVGHSLWYHAWASPGISGEDRLLQLWHEEYLYHPQARGQGSGSSGLFPRKGSKHQAPLSSKGSREGRGVTSPWRVSMHVRAGVSPKRTPEELLKGRRGQMLSEHLLHARHFMNFLKC